MNDLTRIIAALVFVIIWYAMTLIGRALFKPYEKLKLVWCPEARNFSGESFERRVEKVFSMRNFSGQQIW